VSIGRDDLVADASIIGRNLAWVYCSRADAWLQDLFHSATEGTDAAAGAVALVALGGYGRGDLSLQSDLDVLLLHDGRADIGEIAERLWYPVWDEGVKLGHAVRTPKEAMALAADDLDSATALLPARHLAGDGQLTRTLAQDARMAWERRGKRWLEELGERVEQRHAKAGEVAFLLEPDLKEGRGGLRDVHALGWAQDTGLAGWVGDPDTLREAANVLLDVRVELHRRTGRAGDVLRLQEQDVVAAALGDADADALMQRVSTAARHIAWTSDEAWRRIASVNRRRKRRFGRDADVAVDADFVLRDGEIALAETARLEDPSLALRAAAAAVVADTLVSRDSLEVLAVSTRPMPDPWPPSAVDALVAVLASGGPAIGAFEALDHFGLLVRALPEWESVQCRPQRNAYHRFTVDRHLCEAAANAAGHLDRVDRHDLLLIGTWLHDLGKGFGGDHTEVGMQLLASIGSRMGFPPADVDVLVALVEHHLLLPDVATRRDLNDPATISMVAEAAGSLETLRLLHALTEADSLATGPSAWGTWKAELVTSLVDRVRHVLGGGEVTEVTEDFPTDEHAPLLARTDTVIEGRDNVLTVATDDRPGLFRRVTGVLALNGIDVLDAQVASIDGRAIEVYTVQASGGPVIAWGRVEDDLRAAIAGRLAIWARLEEKERAYARSVPLAQPIEPSVTFHHDDSEDSTVVEVRAADGIGVLTKITSAFTEFDLTIVKAKVQTLAHEVVDTFYIQTIDGQKLDPADTPELERALFHALT
jgi:[protein-PII] uridylyltransferase